MQHTSKEALIQLLITFYNPINSFISQYRAPRFSARYNSISFASSQVCGIPNIPISTLLTPITHIGLMITL